MTFNLAPLHHRVGFSGLSGLLKIFAVLVALLNLKVLPLAWHIRLLNGLFTHFRSSRVRLASKVGPAALFQPMIINSRSGFLECDYNLHKSNSTYFSDFDVGRLQLLVSLCTHGLEKTRQELAKDAKAPFSIVLGGVSCNFRREIKPYEGFEIWTRILCWDQKWLYVISHFVKKGAVKPRKYTLQPWRKTPVMKEDEAHAQGDRTKAGPHPAIFASGIAKYVFKKGHLTVPPERVLRNSELLPPVPAEHKIPPVSMIPTPDGISLDSAATSAAQNLLSNTPDEVLAASLSANAEDSWDWSKVEDERQRGMKIASLYNRLHGLHDEFTADGRPILGRY